MNKVIGGNFTTGKKSSIAQYIASKLDAECFNGVKPKSIINSKLVIWMPDISNKEEKDYPKKDKGAVLICSKVMREGYTPLDAVSRIFTMNGNAVIAIYKESNKFRFELRDALNNVWCDSIDIDRLVESIKELENWTRTSIRIPMRKELGTCSSRIEQRFLDINNKLATRVQKAYGQRYFGNLSTRCMKLFPTHRKNSNMIMVSPRNCDKSLLGIEDFVPTHDNVYYNNVKPSVDAPIQIKLYEECKEINYMIHGHATLKGCVTTTKYYPCGDMREYPEVLEMLNYGYRCINLKNHGFLICASTLDELEGYINSNEFIAR